MAFGKDWRVWLKAYAPLVLWICVIFLLSSPKGSMAETSKIIGPLLDFFFPDLSAAARLNVHYFVRKTAHFTEYAILAYMVIRAAVTAGYRISRSQVSVLALGAAVLVACIDEFNQGFEPSRTGSPWDVALDVSGAVAMIILLWLMQRPAIPADTPRAA